MTLLKLLLEFNFQKFSPGYYDYLCLMRACSWPFTDCSQLQPFSPWIFCRLDESDVVVRERGSVETCFRPKTWAQLDKALAAMSARFVDLRRPVRQGTVWICMVVPRLDFKVWDQRHLSLFKTESF